MKKETMAAIVFGILLGGVLAVFLITKNRTAQLANNKTIAPTEKVLQPSTVNNLEVKSLTVVEPDDKTIVNKNSINLKINVVKGALIVIQSPIKDMVFQADKDQITVNFPLAYGENVIRVAMYPKDKQLRSQEKELRIYYFEKL